MFVGVAVCRPEPILGWASQSLTLGGGPDSKSSGSVVITVGRHTDMKRTPP